MIEFTICHFAKNQELTRGETQPSLIVDTALSTLFGAARDIDELVRKVACPRASAAPAAAADAEAGGQASPAARPFDDPFSTAVQLEYLRELRSARSATSCAGMLAELDDDLDDDPRLARRAPDAAPANPINEDDMLEKQDQNNIVMNMLSPERNEPRLRNLDSNGTRYFVGTDRLKRKRSKASLARLRAQVARMQHATADVSRRALNWTRTLRNLRGRRVAQRIDEKCRIVFPLVFLLFNIFYWSFYLVFN